jgi:hypothetical protein
MEKSVTAVSSLTLSGFSIVSSSYPNRTGPLGPQSSITLYEGEVLAPILDIPLAAIKRDPSKLPTPAAPLQPICVAARIAGGGGNDVVSGGFLTFDFDFASGAWARAPNADQSVKIRCQDQTLVGPCAGVLVTACTPKPKADCSSLQSPVGGTSVYFQAGVCGTEPTVGNPFTQAKTGAVVINCLGCLQQCKPGACGMSDGCGQMCRCENGQVCSKSACVPTGSGGGGSGSGGSGSGGTSGGGGSHGGGGTGGGHSCGAGLTWCACVDSCVRTPTECDSMCHGRQLRIRF